jgi:hypothetical protein
MYVYIVRQYFIYVHELAADGAVKDVTENYVGLTDTQFKKRLSNHQRSFTKSSLRYATELSICLDLKK